MRKSEYISYAIITSIVAITLGIILHVYNDTKLEKASIKQVEEFNILTNITKIENIAKETATSTEKTTPNTEYIYETYYQKCGHSEVTKEKISKDDVNKNEDEIKEKYIGWQIKSFSQSEVYLYKEVEKICENHYVVKQNDGKVTIYSVNQDGSETFKEQTEILTKYLPEEDIQLLEKGIKANNETELKEILSDYE